jgi:hypothetical protein
MDYYVLNETGRACDLSNQDDAHKRHTIYCKHFDTPCTGGLMGRQSGF